MFGDLAGEPFDAEELQRRANRQYGLNRYEAVDYQLVREGETRGLEIDLRTKSWGPSFLRLGLGIDNLTDQRYFVYHPYPGRTFYAEAKLSF